MSFPLTPARQAADWNLKGKDNYENIVSCTVYCGGLFLRRRIYGAHRSMGRRCFELFCSDNDFYWTAKEQRRYLRLMTGMALW